MALALSVVPAIAPAQGRNNEGETRHVVILNATDPYLPAFLALDSAWRETIRAGSKAPTQLFAEPLDMSRFPKELFDEDRVALLRKKYRALKIDVVVALAPIALDFAQRHGAEIWPGAIIVFNSVPVDVLDGRSLDPRTIGVPVQLDYGPTIELGLRLRPNARQIAVVAGTAAPDQRHLSHTKAWLARHAGGRDVQYLVGLTLADTVAKVRALPKDTVVLYLAMFRDGAGVPLVPRDVLEQLAAASPAPVFGVFETFLGHGIAAGSIASFAAQGRRTGELVARVLNGEDPAAIGVQAPVAPGCIADWLQLRHWGIDESLLPSGCEVRFKEATLWDRYRWQILATLALILLQAGLIAWLALSHRRLRQAQAAAQHEHDLRRDVETLATRLRDRLGRFSREQSLGAMATAIAHEINQPLIAIQNYAQAAKRRLESSVDDKPKLLELYAKIEGQAARAGTITQRVRSAVSTSDLQLLPVSLAPLLDEVVRIMEPETEDRGCHIVYESAADLPAVLADVLQLQLVLVNLLRNAMQSICSSEQFDKRVFIEARPIDEREVQVSVMDRGRGVPPGRVADIFEPLYSGTSGGMGMGLAISRAIIEAHGGRLWYEANPTGGAIFRFTLRTARP